MNLYLDDLRPCPDGFVLAKTKQECIETLKNNKVHILSLDHDLGDCLNGTGYDVALFLVESQQIKNENHWPNKIYLHTDNPVGRDNMFQLLNRWKPDDVILKRYPYNTKGE